MRSVFFWGVSLPLERDVEHTACPPIFIQREIVGGLTAGGVKGA